ncbi:MAG: Lrp/AsnC ligand binding domain-containing protein [Nitrosopumilus sp.]|nr:Lrp/AsnC ligand binding domain-containing protein [Nitrosopumilus sp.]
MKKAFVLISCDLGKEEDTLVALRTMNQIKEAHGTWGAYDIIAEVESETAESLRETITWKIRKMPAIRATLTLMAIEGQN